MRAAVNLDRFDAILFDLDGTLVDTLADLTRTLNCGLARHHQAPVTEAMVRSCLNGGFESTVNGALEALNADDRVHAAVLSAYLGEYERDPVRLSKLYPSVVDVLRAQHAAGRRMAVCTNKPYELAVRVLDVFALRQYFAVVVGADTCAHRKPAPDPVVFALGRLGVSANRAVLIGDSEVDHGCAQAAGVSFLFFSGGYGQPIAGAMPPDAQFGHFNELLSSQLPTLRASRAPENCQRASGGKKLR